MHLTAPSEGGRAGGRLPAPPGPSAPPLPVFSGRAPAARPPPPSTTAAAAPPRAACWGCSLRADRRSRRRRRAAGRGRAGRGRAGRSALPPSPPGGPDPAAAPRVPRARHPAPPRPARPPLLPRASAAARLAGGAPRPRPPARLLAPPSGDVTRAAGPRVTPGNAAAAERGPAPLLRDTPPRPEWPRPLRQDGETPPAGPAPARSHAPSEGHAPRRAPPTCRAPVRGRAARGGRCGGGPGGKARRGGAALRGGCGVPGCGCGMWVWGGTAPGWAHESRGPPRRGASPSRRSLRARSGAARCGPWGSAPGPDHGADGTAQRPAVPHSAPRQRQRQPELLGGSTAAGSVSPRPLPHLTGPWHGSTAKPSPLRCCFPSPHTASAPPSLRGVGRGHGYGYDQDGSDDDNGDGGDDGDDSVVIMMVTMVMAVVVMVMTTTVVMIL